MTRDIDSPDYSDFSCDSGRDTPAEREVAVLRERAEKAEAEKQAEFDIAQQERRFADDARWERDEAREDIKALEESLEAARERDKWPPCGCSFDRPGDVCGTHWPGRQELVEDIKALVTLLRACGGDRKRLWTDNVRSEWRRIRDRKLLEQPE